MAAATIDQASKELIRYAGSHLQTMVMLVYDGAEADLNAQRTTCAFQPEWQDVRLDLDHLQEVVLERDGKQLIIRTPATGVAGKLFQAIGLPPNLREITAET